MDSKQEALHTANKHVAAALNLWTKLQHQLGLVTIVAATALLRTSICDIVDT